MWKEGWRWKGGGEREREKKAINPDEPDFATNEAASAVLIIAGSGG